MLGLPNLGLKPGYGSLAGQVRALFADGSKGVLFDNNDLSTFYSDAAMTAAAVVNGPVGAQRDKSPNEKHRTQSTATSRPILRGTPTGADLALGAARTDGAGWSTAAGTSTATTASAALTLAALTATVGKVYRVTYTITCSAGSVVVSMGGASGASRSAAGTYTDWLTASGTTALAITGTGFTGTVTTVEVHDVSAGAVTAPYGLQPDGVDDWMSTAAIDFSGTDKMTACFGARKLSDAGAGIIAEFGASDSTNGMFNILASTLSGDTSSRRRTWGAQIRGSTGVQALTGGVIVFESPVTSVVCAQFDLALPTNAEQIAIRVDGEPLVAGYTGTTQAGGTLGNHPIYFGRRGGTSQPFAGLEYGGVIIGKQLTAAQLALVERFTAQRTGVTL